MNIIKKVYKRIFWPVFIIVFITVLFIIGKIVFDSMYPAFNSGYKPTLVVPKILKSSNEPSELSNTEKHGYIKSDEIWSGEIRVVGDVIVAKGAKLTIKPGTVVLIAAGSDVQNLMTLSFWQKKGLYLGEGRDQYIHRGEPYRDEQNHISIWVEGILEAIGTPEKKITVKSDSLAQSRYDWNTFHVENGVIAYAEIRDYRALNVRTGTKLTHSELYNVGECSICIHNSKNVLIENNWIHDSGHEVVDISNSSPIIKNNRFGPSPRFTNPGGYEAGWGGIIVGSGFPVIEGNIIEGFNDAISFFSKDSYDALAGNILKNNTFRNNVENVVLNLNPD